MPWFFETRQLLGFNLLTSTTRPPPPHHPHRLGVTAALSARLTCTKATRAHNPTLPNTIIWPDKTGSNRDLSKTTLNTDTPSHTSSKQGSIPSDLIYSNQITVHTD